MTDKQIIKAFKGCKYSMLECTDCPYGNHMDCERDLDKDVITLMESQQAEINSLQEAIENRKEADRIAVDAYEQLLYEVDYQQGEIERLKTQKNIYSKQFADALNSIERLDKLNESARIDGIKEFVEKLKQQVNNEAVFWYKEACTWGIHQIINAVAKEMTGE